MEERSSKRELEEERTLEKRLMICPDGVESKKDMGARITWLSARGQDKAWRM